MKNLFDIVFVGNISIDKKVCVNGKYVEVIGVSAFNSYCATQLFQNLKNIKVYSNFDEHNILKDINLNQQKFKPNVFIINEKNSSCISEINSTIKLGNAFSCEHLHISFRKGVDITSFLNGNVIYKSLSIDVMLYSVSEFIPLIEKYAERIDFLFCNKTEYEVIKNIQIKGLFIVTNEDKSIEVHHRNNTDYYYVTEIKNKIISTTGAGDSFIGGFISCYFYDHDLTSAINRGIQCAQFCLKTYTNSEFINKKCREKKTTFKLPKKIIVIGPSCAGKSTIIKKIIEKFNFYIYYDDLVVLKERVEIDNENLNTNFKFYKDYLPITRKTKKISETTFKITDETLWQEVIDLICEKCEEYSIIEFSRGTESKKKIDRNNVYLPYIEKIKKKLGEEIVILFVDANFYSRSKRNNKREKLGGHKVEDETFRSIYRFSCKPKNEKIIQVKSNVSLQKLFNKIGEQL